MENEILIKGVERVFNELAGFWIDALGSSPERLESMENDLREMCPAVIWSWGVGTGGRYPWIKVLGIQTAKELIESKD